MSAEYWFSRREMCRQEGDQLLWLLWCLPLLGFEFGYSVRWVALEVASWNRQDQDVVMWLRQVVRASRGFLRLYSRTQCACIGTWHAHVVSNGISCRSGSGRPGMLLNAPQSVRREASSAEFGRESGKRP